MHTLEILSSHKLSWKEISMNIYVGNLPRQASDDELRQAFEAFGKVMSVNIIKDKFSSESRGFGFVEMPKRLEAEAAISGLNGKDFKGQTINVNEARPKADTGRGGRGGYRGRGRRGGGGYGGGRHGGRRSYQE
jgi:RNA recognition motif-containing protein